MPTTANCESQYVHDVACTSSEDLSIALWNVSSIIECRWRWTSMIRRPFSNASAVPPWSASPRASW